MPLPDDAAVIAYLKLETAAESALVTQLRARAEALVRLFLASEGVIVEATAKTYEDVCADRDANGAPTSLLIPDTPVKLATPAPVVTGASGAVVDPATYRVHPETGRIRGRAGVTFTDGPYAIAATVGLGARSDYTTVAEPVLGAAIIDLVADLFQRRNPAAQGEGAGGGVYTQWASLADVPARTKGMLAPLLGITAL
jgi:hypothetical protein